MRELWRIELLGGLRARCGGGVWLTLPPGKPGALLARLALAHAGSGRSTRPVPREELVELLWPEGDPEAGRHNLRGILYALRRLLATAGSPVDDWLRADRATITLAAERFTTDVVDFHTGLAAASSAGPTAARGEALARAVGLWRAAARLLRAVGAAGAGASGRPVSGGAARLMTHVRSGCPYREGVCRRDAEETRVTVAHSEAGYAS